MTDVDDAIATYRRRVQAEADLDESDLDELEEHLRELTDELRTKGLSAAEAVTEAARRLGDPRQLAREHVRVRSPFGVPLSTGRALSAAALFIAPHIVWLVNMFVYDDRFGPQHLPLRVWFEIGAMFFVAIALAARKPWARAVVLGLTVHVLVRWLLVPHAIDDPLLWLDKLGLLAFVMPWRRREISPPAIVLALLAWVYGSAWWGDMTILEQYETNATIALVCAAAACIGTVYRARWSAIASAISALALFGMMFTELGELVLSRNEFNGYWLDRFATYTSGAMAATVAAILAWQHTTRAARKTFRSFTQTE